MISERNFEEKKNGNNYEIEMFTFKSINYEFLIFLSHQNIDHEMLEHIRIPDRSLPRYFIRKV